jgi:hypothetical protein
MKTLRAVHIIIYCDTSMQVVIRHTATEIKIGLEAQSH